VNGRRGQRGVALLLVLVAIALLSVLGALAASLAATKMVLRRDADLRRLTLDLAESGAALALSRLERDTSWQGGEFQVPGGSAAVSVKHTAEGLLVDSRARKEGFLCRLRLLVRVGATGRPRVHRWDAEWKRLRPGDDITANQKAKGR